MSWTVEYVVIIMQKGTFDMALLLLYGSSCENVNVNANWMHSTAYIVINAIRTDGFRIIEWIRGMHGITFSLSFFISCANVYMYVFCAHLSLNNNLTQFLTSLKIWLILFQALFQLLIFLISPFGSVERIFQCLFQANDMVFLLRVNILFDRICD